MTTSRSLQRAERLLEQYAERLTRLVRSAWAAASDATAVAQECSTAEAYTSSNTSVSFVVGDTVCYRLYDVQRKLMSSWFGPCRVTGVLPRGNYTLGDLPNKLVSSKFHVSQLRPYHATLPDCRNHISACIVPHIL